MDQENKIEEKQIDFSKLDKTEDIDVLLDDLGTKNNDAPTEVETPPEAPEVDTPKETEVETPVASEKPEGTPEIPPTPPEKETAKDTELADKFFESLGEEDRKTLEKYKGKPIPEILKALANTQRLVGARADKLKETLGIKPETSPPLKTVPDAINTFKLDDEGVKAREALINKQLKAEFPELPDDPEERKDFLADKNYRDPEWFVDKYIAKKQEIIANVDNVVKTTQYLAKNSPAINLQRIEQAKTEINDYFKKLNIDPKRFDLDIEQGGLENPYLNSVVADEDGNFFTDVVTKYNGIDVIREGAITRKFFEKYLPTIMAKLPEIYRKEGYESANKEKIPGVPTLGVQKPGTVQKKEDITLDKINSLNSVEEIDALLDKM